MKNSAPNLFSDEFVKDTPSFVEIDDCDAGIQISRNNQKDDEDEGYPVIEDGNKGSFESNNLINKRDALQKSGQKKKFIERKDSVQSP